MEHAEFESLVSRLTIDAEAQPRRYRLKILLLSLLGYGYVFFVLFMVGALLAVVGVLIASGTGVAAFLKFGWVLLLFVWSIGSALWVKFDPPGGPVISRAEAPELFALIDSIRKRLRAPRPHVVLAANDVNAAIVQHPRLGILGWPKNYLILGLPLMRATTTSEFEGVLSHEFGHLAGSHGRFGNWIYRQRRFWGSLLSKFEENRSYGAIVFRRFIQWFAPYFQAYTFVLGRQQEYEADQAGAEGSGSRTMADALVRVELTAYRVSDQFWPQVQDQVRNRSQVPAHLFVDLGRRLETGALGAQGDDPRSDEELLGDALKLETTLDDTHPSLRDRLRALGEEARVPGVPECSAARQLLGDVAERLESEFSHEWKELVEEDWKAGYESAVEERARIEVLTALPERDADANWELACLLSTDGRMDEAYARTADVLASSPEHPEALHAWGIHRLREGDEEGLSMLERVLALAPAGSGDACRAAYHFLDQRGRSEESQVWIERAQHLQERADAAAVERSEIQERDRLEAAGIPDERFDGLREQLAADPGILRAWMARKVLQVDPEIDPAYILMLKVSGGWHRSNRKSQKLTDGYAASLVVSNNWFCVLEDSISKRFRKSILAAAGDPFYEKKGK